MGTKVGSGFGGRKPVPEARSSGSRMEKNGAHGVRKPLASLRLVYPETDGHSL